MIKVIRVFLLLTVCALSQDFIRSEWGTYWKDADKDCQDTRQEVLITQSLVPVLMDSTGCKVKSGLWFCLYTGITFSDPSMLDVDHLVPLAEAHASGGYLWTAEQKKAYYNYLGGQHHLLAVYKSANRSKQDRPVDKWLPPYAPTRCAYVSWWLGVKKEWGLGMDSSEAAFVQDYRLANKCP
jgi:hypothetical protein